MYEAKAYTTELLLVVLILLVFVHFIQRRVPPGDPQVYENVSAAPATRSIQDIKNDLGNPRGIQDIKNDLSNLPSMQSGTDV